MLNAHTTFVIGAGAGKEVDFPVGDELLEKIERILSFKYEFGSFQSGHLKTYNAIEEYSKYEEGFKYTINDLLSACKKLVQSSKQATSIDTLIDTLQDDCVSIVGKIAISTAILEAEQNSQKFRIEDSTLRMNISSFKKTWYRQLSQKLFSETKSSELDHIFDNISIVLFNYDRCIEHYLVYSISQHYHVTIERAQDIVSKLRIYRPYDSVGALPWQGGTNTKCHFGSVYSRSILEVSKNTQTFTEQKLNLETVESIKNCIKEADLIVFLGFGFHRQNIDLLSSPVKNTCHVYATCLNIPKPSIGVICNQIAESLSIPLHNSRKRITFADMTCSQFFEQFSTALAAAPPSLQIPLENPHIYRCANS